MKNKILIASLLVLTSSATFARQGEHDGDPNHNDGRSIVCTDKTTGAILLQFISSQGQGQVNIGDIDLTVKTRGDDIGEITLTDKRSGDFLKAKRLEELLKLTLSANENSDFIVVEVKTRRGFAEAEISHPSSGDKAFVKSLSRRGQSSLEVNLTTNENPSSPLGVSCRKMR